MPATLTSRPRRIDFDEGEPPVLTEEPRGPWVEHQIAQQYADVPNVLAPGMTIRPAYMIVFDTDGNAIYRCALRNPPTLTMLPGESVTIQATITVVE